MSNKDKIEELAEKIQSWYKRYPDASAIFTSLLHSVEDTVGSALVVLDTNALLVPYSTSKESLEEIERTYQSLIHQNRLFIPGHVAREFGKRRAENLKEVHQQISQMRDSIKPIQLGSYPLLESVDSYKKAKQLQADTNENISQIRHRFNELLDYIEEWHWDDPVSDMYREMFTNDIFVDPEFKNEEIADQLKWRYDHKIPPGYKDSKKEDSGLGDLLIWYTILQLAEQHKSAVIFVSGDEKADWQHRSEGRAIFPRDELRIEFMGYAGKKAFHMVNFSRFMELFGADEEVLREIREEEIYKRKKHLIEDLNAEKLGKIWNNLLEAAKSDKPGIYALLTEARPFFSDGVLNISFPSEYGFHKERLEQPQNLNYLNELIKGIFGIHCQMSVEFTDDLPFDG